MLFFCWNLLPCGANIHTHQEVSPTSRIYFTLFFSFQGKIIKYTQFCLTNPQQDMGTKWIFLDKIDST